MNHEPLPSLTSWALLTLSDKIGVEQLALAFAEHGIGILSTGGTADYIHSKTKVPVYEVSKYTDFPELMGGRLKTIHPKVAGGILHRRDLVEHVRAAQEYRMVSIDFVVVNLYPFEATIAKPGVTFDEAIEQIDIGGSLLLRAAGKNHDAVTTVVDPGDYPRLIKELSRGEGVTSPRFRLQMAAKAYGYMSKYDGQIEDYLLRNGGENDDHPRLPII